MEIKTFNFFSFFLNTKSLFGKDSFLVKNSSQSFLSFLEIFVINYVNVSTSCQFGLFDFVSLENTQVS